MSLIFSPRLSALCATLLLLGGLCEAASVGPAPAALPTGGVVVAGQATIAASAARMDIQQSSERAVLNWNTFNIGAGAEVHFNQPGSSAIALNRVLSSDPSQLFGTLSANGQVFLINPNGVLFGPGASVNVAGLVASTLNLRDSDFLSGNFHFTRDASTGVVRNQGSLEASGAGYIALLAPEVRNEGVITAQMGSVALAAGEAVTLALMGNQLLKVVVEPAHMAALVDNSRLIRADGGTVYISAQAADQLLGATIYSGGLVEATSLSAHNGAIVLDGGSHGLVSVTGTLDASGKGSGQTGGAISVLGDRVGLFDRALLDVSGDAGGGVAWIGGNFLGQGTQTNASATYLGPLATVDASAITRGNAGQVALWADGYTNFQGSIRAHGGAQGGDGGRVETSGKRILDVGVGASVDAASPKGQLGSWLLDPWTDVTITAALDDSAPRNFAGTNPIVFAPDYFDSHISVGALRNKLTAASVTIMTSAYPANITLSSALDYNGVGSRTLTLVASRNIYLNAAISDRNTTTPDNLSLVLNAGAAGSIVLGDATINLGHGSYTSNARPTLLATGINPSISASGGITFGGSIDASVAGANSLTLLAGGGSVSLAGTVGATAALGTLALDNAGSYNLGATPIHGDLSMTGDTLTLAAPIHVSGNARFSAATSVVINTTVQAGGNIDVSTANGSFSNNAGATVFSAAGYTRVYVQNPSHMVAGGLVPSQEIYACAYSAACGQAASGLGFFYSDAKIAAAASASPFQAPQVPELARVMSLHGPARFKVDPAPVDASEQRIQALYVAYFGRPADPTGLAYWHSVVDAAGSDQESAFASVARSFSGSAEFKSKYAGLNDEQVIDTLFTQLFHRSASADERMHWGVALATGKLTVDQVVTAITDSAQGTDAATYQQQLAAAQSFTQSLDTSSQILGYSGPEGTRLASAYLQRAAGAAPGETVPLPVFAAAGK